VSDTQRVGDSASSASRPCLQSMHAVHAAKGRKSIDQSYYWLWGLRPR
jgi:hypothetical protein